MAPGGGNVSRQQRLQIFFQRLRAAPPATSHAEALSQITTLLNAVEDELSGIPYDPSLPDDGRMYPPQPDSIRSTALADVLRDRSAKHSTLIGENGTIRLVGEGTRRVDLDKPGADGRKIDPGAYP